MGERLDSWKDIATYLGRDLRTVQRWEEDRRLPVHRLPGGDRPRVYALKSELDLWLRMSPDEEREPASVAVLPFANLTADKETEFFGDGLADEIINALTRIPGLRVTARTSSFAFRSTEQDVREIGAHLGATALLEGSVRRQHNRVRVCAQLVNVKDGYHLWSETYDRELSDIFAIQDDLAHSIARALRVKLAPTPVVEQLTGNLEAYDLWLKGRCLAVRRSPETVTAARQCFQDAIARDPRFPLPYLGIAELLFEATSYLILPSAEVRYVRPNILKALALNESLGEAHALLGTLEGTTEYDWTAAERAFERAFELSPGSSTVHWRHASYFLAPKLRIAEAVQEMHYAVALDPLSPLMYSSLGLTLIAARDYAKAEAACRTAMELGPGLFGPHWFLASALAFRGAEEEALAEARTAASLFGGPAILAGMCALHGLLGRIDEARRCFAQVMDQARTAPIQALGIAWAHLGVGDDRVFDWLDKAIEERDPSVTHLPFLPLYDGIRGDPRFRALLAKMRLA